MQPAIMSSYPTPAVERAVQDFLAIDPEHSAFAVHVSDHLIGTPLSTDVGWDAVAHVETGDPQDHALRTDMLNPHQSMMSSAGDLTRW